MKKILKKISISIFVLSVFLGVVSYTPTKFLINQAYAAVTNKIPVPIALYEDSLQSAITSSATSFTLVRGTDIVGTSLATNTYGFIIDEGSSSQEFVLADCTGTTCTNAIRGVSPITGLTSVSSLQKTHRRGASVKITDSPILLILKSILNGEETLPNTLTYATGVTPSNSGDLADKEYVLSVVSGGTVSFEKVVVQGLAGETVVAGELLYHKQSDGLWWKTDADTSSTVEGVDLGIAQGGGTAGNAISNGILTLGVDTTNTGTTGAYAYASNTAGDIGSSTGTTEKIVGQFVASNGGVYFNPNFYYTIKANQKNALAGGGDFGTPSSSNKYLTEDYALSSLLGTSFGDGSDGDVTVSASTTTTLTRDMYYDNLVVNGTINTGGYRIFVKGTISGSGTVANNGNNGSNGTAGGSGGAAGAAGTATVGYFTNTAGGIGGAGKQNGSGNSGTAGTTIANALSTTSGGNSGYGGGYNGATGAGAGVYSSTTTAALTRFAISKFQTVAGVDINSAGGTVKYTSAAAGGGGGGGGSSGGGAISGGGGGGGASGGIVAIFAKNWTGTFTISSTGGNGGDGGAGASGGGHVSGGGGGGGGGNGGYVFTVYGVKTWTGSYTLTAGSGGTAGAASGSPAEAGGAGIAGGSGVSKEIQISSLL